MSMQNARTEPITKYAKHRQGVATQLKSIRATVEDLSAKLDEVISAQLVRKSITMQSNDYGD